MPKSTMPGTGMQTSDPIEDLTSTYEAMLPKQFGGAVNLFIHPMAGAAAMAALGFGVASHAMGLWVGAVAGAADASRRMLESASESNTQSVSTPKRARQRKLELVSSNEDADVTAAIRSVAAHAERIAAEVARTAHEIADEADVEGTKATEAAAAIAGVVADVAASAKPKGIERPAAIDDLKAISGIGPKLEQVLNGMGVWTYAQIAAFSEAEIAWLDNELGFSGRIKRDDWIGQASKLATAKRGTG